MTARLARPFALLCAAAALVAWLLPSSAAAPPPIFLPLVTGGQSVTLYPFTGLPNATAITHAGDDRLFVALTDGRIYVVAADGTLDLTPFLDIRDRVAQEYWEQGLLGLAFHPDFAANGRFYVYYSASEPGAAAGPGVLARFTAPPQGPVDPATEVRLLTLPHTAPLHYGGDLAFGPDGYLYVASGDSGDASLGVQPPPVANAQNGANLLGKLLRLDVDGGAPYAIPPDNPFVGDDGIRDEIWVLGLRNPWRFSFDRATGDLWIADVGEARSEEVNRVAAGESGQNFGWPCYEGTNRGPQPTGCGAAADYDPPLTVYDHTATRCSITGGYVYRGAADSPLWGQYLFADFCSGEMWRLPPGGGPAVLIGEFPDHRWSTFGENAAGELFVGEFRGSATIYRLQAR